MNFPTRAARDRYELSLLREETGRLRLEMAAKLRAKLRNGKDIVRDDENDFRWWAAAFKVLRPPRFFTPDATEKAQHSLSTKLTSTREVAKASVVLNTTHGKAAT